MKNPRFLFWFIVAITILAVLIDLPSSLKISYNSSKIPFINKSVQINKTLTGFQPDFFIGSYHFQKEFPFRKGLDLEGGTSITLKADMKDVPADKRKDALDGAKNVIERRINFLGVSEPVIQTSIVKDEHRIIVELPGVTDINQAVQLIGTTAQLSFWEEGASGSAEIIDEASLPAGIKTIFQNPQKTNLTGKDLKNSVVTFDPNTSQPQVQLSFSNEGEKKFAKITQDNVGKIVAIALDNQVIQAPRVNEPILNGNAVISGGFTANQAKTLSIQLQAGALPVPLSILEQHTVGATLGNESLQKSLFAGILGFLVIVIFMSVLYGRLGVLASFALVLYAIFVLAIFKIIPVTLTLAGIAGFILSIGMAVDANILIFERMREELRSGRSFAVAIELGFARAWTSIRDSNVSSIITSLILIYFGSGIVRGFAVTLLIGVLISMFSAIIVTRTFLRLIYKS